MSVQPMGSQIASSTNFTWKITNFTKLTETEYYSVPFTIRGNIWKILLFPKGNNTDHLSLYLYVADSETLPHGWTISTGYSLKVVNQRNTESSIKKEAFRTFNARESGWGFRDMVSLAELSNGGFLVNDTIIINASFKVASKELPVDASAEMLDFYSYFTGLEQFISGISADATFRVRSSSDDARSPNLDEVGKAKLSLKECLSDLFKQNMNDRLAGALSILSRAKFGLSAGQLSSVRAFWARFGEFTSDFLTFEQYNAEFELHKLLKEEMFSKMREGLETHLQFKKSSEEITKEEEECERKMEEITKEMERLSVKKAKLESDSEVLLAESQDAKFKYAEHEKKAKDAEKKKRVAEKQMSRSTAAWSSLKAEFSS